jgi:uncharacterized protein with GYD domain
MLFSLTVEYTPAAINAMRENQSSQSRQEAVKNLIEAAGGKLIAIYFKIVQGPGAQVVFDVPDPAMAAAITSVAIQGGGVQNPRLERLYTQDEVLGIRQRVNQIRDAYKTPGQ